MKIDLNELLAENTRRNKLIVSQTPFDIPEPSGRIDIERCRNDFRYWAVNAVRIRDKKSGREVPFVLNRAQAGVLEMLEAKRLAGEPIRLIILKARQWGASTLVQVYMAWIQLVHRRNWHSVTCAHVKDAARTIRSMYDALLRGYPECLVVDDDSDCGDDAGEAKRSSARRKTARKGYSLDSFGGAQNIRVISRRNCRVAIASAECQDSIRGSDIAMAQLSEVAYWPDSTLHDPEDFMRAVCSSVPIEPYTFVVVESTANGVGNFFHREWLRAVAGESDKTAVFVPWYKCDAYALSLRGVDLEAFVGGFDAYEENLWTQHGCTLEQIHWYRRKRREYGNVDKMHAEFPTTPTEAFVASDANVFDVRDIDRLRAGCCAPRRFEIGADGRCEPHPAGRLEVWSEPCPDGRYVAAVDVGGRSRKSDFSVIAVMRHDEVPEVVAQWRGHIDHDLLADKAIALSRRYNNALLVIESNTLETVDESQSSASVLQRVARTYPWTYRRTRRHNGDDSMTAVGFHTNRHTKALLIDNMMAAVRECAYVERDEKACNELATYRRLPNGSYEACRGNHDDLLMTRAIALYVMTQRPMCRVDDYDACHSASARIW